MRASDVVRSFEDTMQRALRGEAEQTDVLGHLTDDVVVHEAPSLPYPGEYRGHEGFLQMAAVFRSTWSFRPGKTFEFLDSGDGRVVVLTLGQAIANSSGKEIEWRLAEVFTVHEGKIAEIRPFYWDTAAVVAATQPQ